MEGGTRAEYQSVDDRSLSQTGFETMLDTKLCIHVYVGCLKAYLRYSQKKQSIVSTCSIQKGDDPQT